MKRFERQLMWQSRIQVFHTSGESSDPPELPLNVNPRKYGATEWYLYLHPYQSYT